MEDTDCCKVLYDRYVLNWSFEEIARARYTRERQVFRWHGDGLLAVEKILENNKVGSKCQLGFMYNGTVESDQETHHHKHSSFRNIKVF